MGCAPSIQPGYWKGEKSAYEQSKTQHIQVWFTSLPLLRQAPEPFRWGGVLIEGGMLVQKMREIFQYWIQRHDSGAGFVRHWRQRGAVAFIFISFWYESLGGFIYCHPFPGILFVYAVPGAPAPHPGFPIPPGCAAVLPPVFPIPAGPAARQDSPATGPASSQPALAASSGQPDRVGTLCAALFCGPQAKSAFFAAAPV